MRLLYIDIPNTDDILFSKSFVNKVAELNGLFVPVHSTGTSWKYPAQIKGWRDWDFTSQSQGKFREVDEFNFNSTDILVTTVRNPFNLLYQYFINDWARCREHHNLPTETHTIEDFHKFVDIYLDRSIVFHAPLFRKSLFSQLKDIEGNWLLTDTSIIQRYETIEEDIVKFSKFTGLSDIVLEPTPSQTNYFDMYTSEHIKQLEVLWKDDLEYFGYTSSAPTTKNVVRVKPKQITSKKKIAICFSGEIRDLERTKDYWSKLIKEYDMDVYGSFWDTYNYENWDTIENFNKIYNVKNVEVENYNSFNNSTLSILRMGIEPQSNLVSYIQDSCMNFGTMSMWYKIWRANLLTKESNIDYDIVIRARTDSYFNDNLDISVNGMLNVPHGRVRLNNYDKSEGIADLFAYGSPKLMDYYSVCYFFIMSYLTKGYNMVPHEHLLHAHLNKISVPIRFMGTNIIITRESKGTDDEVYCRQDVLTDEILQSDYMDLEPQKDIFYKENIKEAFKL